MPGVVYFHPWEIDPGQPRRRLGVVSGLRHYTNLGRMEHKVRALFRDFRFASVKEVLLANGFGLHEADSTAKIEAAFSEDRQLARQRRM
jgi:hypothetical protein